MTSLYDIVPYTSQAYPATYPDRLYVVARLFGLPAAPIGRARVLELGCGAGGNLLPMGEALPEATFLGIDESRKQVDTADKLRAELGLRNVEFREMDLCELLSSNEKYDYIIAHGVFSWVPPEVAMSLLRVIKHCLASAGVAYISYLTLPGARSRMSIRDLCLFHTRKIARPLEKVGAARALLKGWLQSLEDEARSPFDALKLELRSLQSLDDSLFLHDILAEHHRPVFFHELLQQSHDHGLQYLGEAEFHEMTRPVAPDLQAELGGASKNLLLAQQYSDFLGHSQLRKSLLVHSEVELDRNITTSRITGWFAGCSAIAAPDDSTGSDEFLTREGTRFRAPDDLTRRIAVELRAVWPGCMSVEELTSRLCIDGMEVSRTILQLFRSGIVELRSQPIDATAEVPECPRTSSVTRISAHHSLPLVNLRHETFHISEPARALLVQLDGQKCKEQLRSAEDLDQLLRGLAELGFLASPGTSARRITDKDVK